MLPVQSHNHRIQSALFEASRGEWEVGLAGESYASASIRLAETVTPRSLAGRRLRL
jgi:hypothetical protein